MGRRVHQRLLPLYRSYEIDKSCRNTELLLEGSLEDVEIGTFKIFTENSEGTSTVSVDSTNDTGFTGLNHRLNCFGSMFC